ncbi:XkdQ/YqbQ family protein [Clostridium magnum]|uniref:YqbQ/XkdQ domain-containing protein n=1 Tax=Clostridium magnum DSM 2767 TaxID=1121326 RepID=A0A162UX46_9CLOT|nr:hypothetical protein [Clostridium magnum]KZL94373.1 hypothetical protein CLMAG_14260 [Clostridium magnum DSM 2767]SHJ50111.1 hypothetical protein SAMN02745944_06068 [Clostridium magnum DSM 2767]
MIKLYSLYQSPSKGPIQTDITNFCKTIVWSGDKEQVARKLDVTMSYSIWDKNQPNVQIAPGTLIWMQEDGKELFRGHVFDREIGSQSQELKFVAFDCMIYLTKSKGSYNFTNITPEDIVRTICGDAGIFCGDIGTSGYKINLLAKQKSFYEIIMMAYTKVWHFNGGKYNFMPYMNKDVLGIMNMGVAVDNFVISPSINLGNTNYSDTISNMVNKVNIYNDKGEYLGTAWQREWIKAYGVLQDVYEASEDDKSPLTTANSMLHGVDETIIVNLLGNTKCITGWGVTVNIPYIYSLANTVMCIDADTHTWEVATGLYTMDLTLNFKTKMKLVEVDK